MTLDQILQQHAETTSIGSEILKQALAENAKDRGERMVSMAKRVLAEADANIKINVVALRSIRKQEKQQAEKTQELGEAIAYFKGTGNPFPYLKLSGNRYGLSDTFADLNLSQSDYPEGHEIYKVPAGWTPPAAATNQGA